MLPGLFMVRDRKDEYRALRSALLKQQISAKRTSDEAAERQPKSESVCATFFLFTAIKRSENIFLLIRCDAVAVITNCNLALRIFHSNRNLNFAVFGDRIIGVVRQIVYDLLNSFGIRTYWTLK